MVLLHFINYTQKYKLIIQNPKKKKNNFKKYVLECVPEWSICVDEI